ncbi:hypothetical protein ACFOHS_18670 [Jhaorihella thermophila]
MLIVLIGMIFVVFESEHRDFFVIVLGGLWFGQAARAAPRDTGISDGS